MGFVSMLGGITGLRLPETLHQRLPQTIEEGEEFGKEWTVNACLHCKTAESSASQPTSYENLDVLHSNTASDVELEMNASSSSSGGRRSMRQRPKSIIDERTPLDGSRPSRPSMKRLVRQMSVMDTQRTEDGTMQLTHWI